MTDISIDGTSEVILPDCFADCYRGLRVLVTGHTGFKGSWLLRWLELLGAKVYGLSLPPETTPNHFSLLAKDLVVNHFADVRNQEQIHRIVQQVQPDMVFHLAAQSLVRRSYREPHPTFETNVIGTLNVLQACRDTTTVRAIVCVTSDKVYENTESAVGYVETDRLGGYDPYSCSKACAELLTACFRASYLPVAGYGQNHRLLLATARAGNVIGGGDWSEDRLIPDAVRATVESRRVLVRHPSSVRPWQHVLEPLSGYLLLGQRLLEGKPEYADAWNFGPAEDADISVETVIRETMANWNRMAADFASHAEGPHETSRLKVDSSKANHRLNWKPIWNWKEAIARTAKWYRAYYDEEMVLTVADIRSYVDEAKRSQASWVAK